MEMGDIGTNPYGRDVSITEGVIKIAQIGPARYAEKSLYIQFRMLPDPMALFTGMANNFFSTCKSEMMHSAGTGDAGC